MGLLDIASNNSFWRGYDYYENGMVISFSSIGENKYEGKVRGSSDNTYDVVIDVYHPKKSTCTCPHAEGTRKVCKHKVAIYLSVFPEEGKRIVKEAEEYDREQEELRTENYMEIERYVNSLTKQELREELLWRLLDEEDRHWY